MNDKLVKSCNLGKSFLHLSILKRINFTSPLPFNSIPLKTHPIDILHIFRHQSLNS